MSIKKFLKIGKFSNIVDILSKIGKMQPYSLGFHNIEHLDSKGLGTVRYRKLVVFR
jgi:hypothetical protein